VRRRLVQRFHRNLLDAARPAEPSRDELVAFIDEGPESYQTIPRLSFVHVYVDGEADHEPPAQASALLEQLRRESIDPAAVGNLGDPLLLQREFRGATPVDLAKRFGHAFTEALTEAPSGAWSGPYPSVLGWHLAWLHDYRPPEVVLDEATLAKARSRLIERRKEVMVRSVLAELRQRYEIVVGMPREANSRREG
jgi:hypothetical protein